MAQLGLRFYALAAIFTILAASLSGLVIPQIIAVAHHGRAAARRRRNGERQANLVRFGERRLHVNRILPAAIAENVA